MSIATASQAEIRLPSGLITKPDLCQLLSVTRPTLNIWIREGRVPKPVEIGRKAYWRPEQIRSLLGLEDSRPQAVA